MTFRRRTRSFLLVHLRAVARSWLAALPPCVALIAMVMGTSSVWAAKEQAAAETPLTEAGQKLLERYAGILTELQAEISKAVPAVDEQKKAAYPQAREAEKAADTEVKAAQQRLGKIATAQALVSHAKGKWIGGAEKGIAEAQAKLKKATTEAERDAAQKELVKWQENRVAGISALKERQEALDKAQLEEPKLIQELEAAQEALAQTQARTMQAISALNLESFLSSDKLDARLAKYVVLFEATPRGLAEFAQQGKEQEQLVERLLAAVGEDIGEANESQEKDVVEAVTLTDADRKIVVGAGGVITIPAVARSKPTNSTQKIVFMPNCLGGMHI